MRSRLCHRHDHDRVPEGVAVRAVPYRLGNRHAVPALSDEADFGPSSSSGGDFGDADVTDGR